MQEFYSKLAGVTFSNKGVNTENRQRIIRDLALEGELKPGTELMIKRMPENPYDSDSVAVFAPDGRQLGFLPNRKENPVATTVSRNLQEGYRYRVFVARVTGGLAGAVYGINIKIQVTPPSSQSTAEENEDCENFGNCGGCKKCKKCKERYKCSKYLAERFGEHVAENPDEYLDKYLIEEDDDDDYDIGCFDEYRQAGMQDMCMYLDDIGPDEESYGYYYGDDGV